MHPRLERWPEAQLAQLVPTQQAPAVLQGFWLSVMMRPLSPAGWLGSGTLKASWEPISAVQVCALAAPTAPGLGQWSSAVAATGSQRVRLMSG